MPWRLPWNGINQRSSRLVRLLGAGTLAFILPFVFARMTLPVVACYHHRDARKKHSAISNTLIQFVKSNVQRLTPGTPRLLVFADAIYIELFRRFLCKNFACRFGVLGTD